MGDGRSRVAAFVSLLACVGPVCSSPFYYCRVFMLEACFELLMSRLSFIAVAYLCIRLYFKGGIVPLSCAVCLAGPCGVFQERIITINVFAINDNVSCKGHRTVPR